MIGLNHEDLEKALKILKSHGKRTVMQQQVLFTGGNAAASGGDGSDPCSLRRCRVVCPGCRQV